MRDVTQDEQTVLDQIPTATLGRYWGKRVGEARRSWKRTCGHANHREGCAYCEESSYKRSYLRRKAAEELGMTEDRLGKRLEQLVSTLNADHYDLPGWVVAKLGCDRGAAVRLVRLYELEDAK